MAEATQTDRKPKSRGSRVGLVVSSKEDKTVRVEVQALVEHPQDGKIIGRRTKLAAHEPNNEARDGDRVEIAPCRPLSKSKAWRLVRILRRSEIER